MSDPWRAWFSLWETQVAAATTIAARMPILLTAARTGSPKAMRETQRMYSEKYAAAFEGAMAAGQEWARMWLRTGAGMGNWLGPATNASRIMQAAMKPAQVACKANARRLGGGRKKRRRRSSPRS